MLLQRLMSDEAEIMPDHPPDKYNFKLARWALELDSEGRLRGEGFILLSDGHGGPKDKGRVLLVPDRTRTGSAPIPLPLADKAEYVLGFAGPDADVSQQDKVGRRHESCVELHRVLAEQVDEPDLRAVVAFLDSWDSRSVDPPADLRSADVIAFRVDGRWPFEYAPVQRWWAANWAGPSAPEDHKESSATVTCQVCGRHRPAQEFFTVKIKGLIAGQSSGTTLISANDAAYESYGLKRALTSGVCASCGETTSLLINRLLASDINHLNVGPISFIFWASGPSDFNLATHYREPTVGSVKELLRSYRTGRDPHEADLTPFHLVALATSGGRAAVRLWLDTTVGDMKTKLAEWFTRIDIVTPDGVDRPLGYFPLVVSLFRDTNDIPPSAPLAFAASALTGAVLPKWVLAKAVLRNRAESRVTYPRAALIKAVLTQDPRWKDKAMTELDPSLREAAYACGRLLAVLEEVQRAALGKIGTTVVDRFYGAASTAPATVFGKLMSDSQAHLGKLRRTRPGAHAALEARLEEVLAGIDAFPKTLTLAQQGLFSLGYYHQRAADRAARTSATTAQDQED